MRETTEKSPGLDFELPSTAPLVRVTAGVGSAGQKTWNLRRPITLIGSHRPAHIVLHDQGITKAHCVIVNTGAEVLIKDLHTGEGTFRNKTRIDLSVLSDGDIITVGDTRIQVAIQSQGRSPEDSGFGLEVTDPLKFRELVTIRQEQSDRQWRIEDAVVLVGRHEQAAVSLDHEEVSTRHAVIFRFVDRPAIFDLGSRRGVLVNGEPCTVSRLREDNCIAIGAFSLRLGAAEPTARAASASAPPPNGTSFETGVTSDAKPSAVTGPPSLAAPAELAIPSLPPIVVPSNGREHSDPVRSLADIESELGTLHKAIAESWERLNSWHSRLREDATALNKHETDLAARETRYETKDAALRGQLHDLTRYHEQIAARERDLADQASRLRAEQETLQAAQTACAERETGLTKRSEELQRREHVFAQRWNRLLTAQCAHCGKPVDVRERG